ncbi:MAG TPA: hypothetical protein VGO56_17520 [Pyrinomonadaceae bacterium]|jgi:hypothetical protein|nr:hypothetical protein [Pyrinomonadaceae bacterium]
MWDSTDYWVKAQENLEMALLAYQCKKHNVCASRAYYSVFLASIAVLVELTDLRARDNEWDHGQVQAELNRRLGYAAESFTGRHRANADGPDCVKTYRRLQARVSFGQRSETSFRSAKRFLLSVASALEENE